MEFKMKIKRINVYLIVICLLLAIFLLTEKKFLPARSQLLQFSPGNAELISTVMGLIRTDYLEEPNPDRITEGAFRGLVNSLDPLSAYLDKDLAAKYLNRKEPVKGTGLIIFKRYGVFPVVTSVLEKSPASRAGLKIGDNLSAINDHNTMNLSLLEANLLLEAEPEAGGQQPAKLRVLRGSQTLEIEVSRDFILSDSLKVTAGPSGLLIIHFNRIYEGVAREIQNSLIAHLKRKPAPGAVVLDLRGCWTGDYEEARKVINLFLEAKEFGYLETRGQKQPLSCPDEPAFPKLRLAVWVDQATCGPAEMVAGVLKDFNRARTVGLNTPGLAGIQENFPLTDGSLVVMTTAVFSLKSGTRLWDKSLPLDARIPYSENMDKAYLDKTSELLLSKN